jgi:hypothetical protein
MLLLLCIVVDVVGGGVGHVVVAFCFIGSLISEY